MTTGLVWTQVEWSQCEYLLTQQPTYDINGVCVCRGEVASSLNRDNPLYESQEIRMEMFADVQSEDEEGKYTHAYTQHCIR